jgi:bacteriorhodopsin
MRDRRRGVVTPSAKGEKRFMDELVQNVENFISYAPASRDIILHVITFGVAAHLAALLYFILTSNRTAPKYRLSSTISAVVMISAALSLYLQRQSWQDTFVYDLTSNLWVRGAGQFSNGYRYINWTIDVPMLLTQLLIVLGFTGSQFRSRWWKMIVAGLGMIYTGYIGQFYEVSNIPLLLLWGTISTVFYVYLLYLVWQSISAGLAQYPHNFARPLMRNLRWLLIISWSLYPGAYLAPLFGINQEVVVARQIIFTVADVASKVVYGVMLSFVAEALSVAERNRQALVAQGVQEDGATVVAQT